MHICIATLIQVAASSSHDMDVVFRITTRRQATEDFEWPAQGMFHDALSCSLPISQLNSDDDPRTSDSDVSHHSYFSREL